MYQLIRCGVRKKSIKNEFRNWKGSDLYIEKAGGSQRNRRVILDFRCLLDSHEKTDSLVSLETGGKLQGGHTNLEILSIVNVYPQNSGLPEYGQYLGFETTKPTFTLTRSKLEPDIVSIKYLNIMRDLGHAINYRPPEI